jgi:hypothetical protein
MQNREAILAEARTWIGTPFRHQGATKAIAADCWGLVRRVGEACGVLEIQPEALAPFSGYPPHPSADFVRSLAEAFLLPTDEPRAGDVALLGSHMAILAEFKGRATLIHAKGSGDGARYYASRQAAERVVEHGFRPPWPGLVTGWYRYPGV